MLFYLPRLLACLFVAAGLNPPSAEARPRSPAGLADKLLRTGVELEVDAPELARAGAWRWFDFEKLGSVSDGAPDLAAADKVRLLTEHQLGLLPIRRGLTPSEEETLAPFEAQRDGFGVLEFRHQLPRPGYAAAIAELRALSGLLFSARGEVAALPPFYHLHMSRVDSQDRRVVWQYYNLLLLLRAAEREPLENLTQPDAQISFRAPERKGLLRVLGRNHVELRLVGQHPEAEAAELARLLLAPEEKARRTLGRKILARLNGAMVLRLARASGPAAAELYQFLRTWPEPITAEWRELILARLEEDMLGAPSARARKRSLTALSEILSHEPRLHEEARRQKILAALATLHFRDNSRAGITNENAELIQALARGFGHEPAVQLARIEYARYFRAHPDPRTGAEAPPVDTRHLFSWRGNEYAPAEVAHAMLDWWEAVPPADPTGARKAIAAALTGPPFLVEAPRFSAEDPELFARLAELARGDEASRALLLRSFGLHANVWPELGLSLDFTLPQLLESLRRYAESSSAGQIAREQYQRAGGPAHLEELGRELRPCARYLAPALP